MSLEGIYQRTHIAKTTVYRILKTFVHRGYLAQSQDGLYRLAARPRKVRFGFGKQSGEMPFSEAVTASLRDAATQAGVDLMVLDNRYDGKTAGQVAEELVKDRVGVEAGALLAEYVVEKWGGKVDWVLGLDIENAGPLVQSRITGVFQGIRN